MTLTFSTAIYSIFSTSALSVTDVQQVTFSTLKPVEFYMHDRLTFLILPVGLETSCCLEPIKCTTP